MPPPRKHKPPDLFAECMTFAAKHLFKDKRTRQDVTLRKLVTKETSCTVVKTTWNSFCKPPGKALALESCLLQVNKAVAEAYLLANVHVLRICELQKPISELGQTFYYQCLSAVSRSERNKSDIKDMDFRHSVELYESYRPAGYFPPRSTHLASGWFQQASQQMAIAAKNSVSMNFWRRFKRYLKSKYDLGKDAWMTVREVQATTYDGEDEIVLRYRAMLPTKPRFGNIEDCPELVMPLQHLFLRHFESSQDNSVSNGERCQKQHRLFSMLPTKQGFECSHLKMCTNGLYGLLKLSGVKDLPPAGKPFREVADAFWRRLFDIDKFETRNRKFGGEILSDGVSVSIVLRKPKTGTNDASTTVSLEDYDQVLGLDPGRTDLFSTCDVRGQHLHHSTKQYYEDAGYKKSNRKIQGWQQRDEFVRETYELMPRKKTGDSDVMKKYIEYVLPKMERLLRWSMKKPFRKLKLTRYIHARKALRKLCAKLTSEGGSRTLIGFGDWSNRDSAGIIKKSPAGPVKKLESELRKVCKVVSVDEFRTSKVHNTCGCKLHHRCCHKHKKKKHIKEDSDAVGKAFKVHKVLFCDNRSCNSISMDRDENASRNILQLLIQQLRNNSRPAHFSRGCKLEECTGAPFGEVPVQPVSVVCQ